MIIKQAKKAYQNKEFAIAENLLTKHLNSNNQDAESYYQRGMCRLHQNKMKDCLEDFVVAKEIEPNNPYRHSSIAFIYSKLNQTDKAIKSYTKAIELDPDDAISLNNLGIIEEKRGNVTHAKKLYDHADLNLGIEKKESIDVKPNQSNSLGAILQVAKQVLTTKKGFNEFVNFIFKTKK